MIDGVVGSAIPSEVPLAWVRMERQSEQEEGRCVTFGFRLSIIVLVPSPDSFV